MSVKRYFKKEFKVSMFGLENDDPSCFYLNCFQGSSSTSAMILLVIRLVVAIGCIGILLSSLILTTQMMSFGMWFLFLTHWGIILITITAVLAFAVSLRAVFGGPFDATFGLPWYVKAYWVSYNATLPIALFITLFYWIFLTSSEVEFAIDLTLDIFIHAINSVLMIILLVTSCTPSRVLHFHHPILMGIVYLLFSVIYYLAGGLGPFNTGWIYPMLDWSNPGLGTITAVGSAIAILVIHLLVVGMSLLRDKFTNNRDSPNSMSVTSSDERYY